ncbi:MAG: amino acid ABC transporter ATP-binding protein [Deltaproteobacteria bacterium]|jgi:L-cystine transport system ATP-binding protein|nr:amino acid ABC transporter ATP-binding protein [Deltaproteobacteria bacterium]
MFEMRGIKKSFNGNRVLNGVDVTVDKGEVVAIIGASGSGKTTLLRCANFLERADEGNVRVGDKWVDVKKANKKDILDIRRMTAFVFQNYSLFSNKTALGNVSECLTTPRKVPRDEARRIAMEALTRVGIADKADDYPSELSGGQQQRVGIARAIAVSPDIIFLDEPTSALDPELIGEILLLLKDLALAGATMLIVTHEIRFAMEVANQVLFMDEGLVVESGPPREIFRFPKEERTRAFLRRFTSDFDYQI